MGLKPEHRYNGVVGPNSQLITTQRGSLGYQVNLVCEDGETCFVIWLTEKNRSRALGYFAVLGVPADKLQSKTYFDLQLGLDIEGREISFGTQVEEYNGESKIKVAWIGKKAAENPAAEAAAFFSGKASAPSAPVASSAGGNGRTVPEDEIPF